MTNRQIELNSFPCLVSTVSSHGGCTVKLSCEELGLKVTPFQLTIVGLLNEGNNAREVASLLGRPLSTVNGTIALVRDYTQESLGLSESYGLEKTRDVLGALGLLNFYSVTGFKVFAQEILQEHNQR